MKIKNIIRSNRQTNPFGGILLAMHEINKRHIPSLIDNKLGKRAKQAKFSLSDVIMGWIYSNLCGADRLEDANNLKRKCFSKIEGYKYASPDSIGLIFKSLATKSLVCHSEPTKNKMKKSITHEFNTNPRLNELLLDIAVKLDLIKKDIPYTLDYDNTIIKADKYDATYSYKNNSYDYKIKGYQPGAAFCGKIPVYIENRQGKTGAVYKMTETIQRSLDNLERHGIKPKRFRSDAAAYQHSIIKLMEANDIEYFIRAKNNELLIEESEISLGWEERKIGFETRMFYDIKEFKVRGLEKPFRIVVERTLRENNEDKAKSKYVYYGIMTNNNIMSMEEVVNFYNQRGNIENNFKALKYDFNWNHLPFSYLDQNSVFLIISAMANVIYEYIIRKFSKKVDFVKKTFRLKKFIQYVITLNAILYEDGTMEIEGSEYDYEPLRDL